jgi:pullulanase/glycogen debranching enzyme
MPRGNGTGPFGKGPLNRKSSMLKKGNNRGNTKNKNRNSYRCKNETSTLNQKNDFASNIIKYALKKIPGLILKIAPLAFPVASKIRRQIQDKKEEKMLEINEQETKEISMDSIKVIVDNSGTSEHN